MNRQRPPLRPPPPVDLSARLAALEERVTALEHDGAVSLLRAIRDGITRLEAQGDKLMAVAMSTQEIVNRLRTATNTLATNLQSLRDQLVSATTAAEVDALLQPIVSDLEALGTNPNNPVPDPTPV